MECTSNHKKKRGGLSSVGDDHVYGGLSDWNPERDVMKYNRSKEKKEVYIQYSPNKIDLWTNIPTT